MIPIAITLAGMVTDVSDAQSLNAKKPNSSVRGNIYTVDNNNNGNIDVIMKLLHIRQTNR